MPRMSSYFFLAAAAILITCRLLQCPKTSASTETAAKQGCRNRCGPTPIPYPFGIGRGCYLDETFEVSCNESTGAASLSLSQWEIDQISVPTHSLRHTNFIVLNFAFDQQSGQNLKGQDVYLRYVYSRYSTPHAKNVGFVVGCDLYAYIIDEDTKEFLGGCASLCNDDMVAAVRSSTCSGLYCCQLTFDRDIRNMTLRVETINTLTKSWAGRCGFFGFMDKDYPLNGTEFTACNRTYFTPIRHSWDVGHTSCEIARGRGDYACGGDAYCVDNSEGSGYRCFCNKGYQGNPYLRDGCQDINECASPRDNNCRGQNLCANTAGGYYCLADRSRVINLFVPLGAGLAVGILIMVVGGVWALKKLKSIKEKKTKQKFFKRNGGLLLRQQMFSHHGGRSINDPILFRVEELRKATDNLNPGRIVGKGGSGTVYKGMLSDGRVVAVKRANRIDDKEVSQFVNEVFVLSQINHRHIVKLLGCCLESEVPLLAYEFIANGTLSGHLHSPSDSSAFSWENRLRIASEVAGALAYLHSYASTAIIHRDVKSSNVLLDENFRAVLSDFGISRSVAIDRTHLTTVVRGTFGYLDPEYFRSAQLNDKSDVYAFGVVLAEILTGERAVSSMEGEPGLAVRFMTASSDDYLFEKLEGVIGNDDQRMEILAVADVARMCLKTSARKRPSMREVSAELDRIRKMNGFTAEQNEEERRRDHAYRSVSERSYSFVFDSSAEDDHKLFWTK